jgi:glutathione S-transferase
MSFDPNYLTTANPVFHAYVLAASLMLLKLMLQPWMTVQRMMKVRAGFRSPEDAKQTPLNPEPREGQLEPNEYVERSRRMNLNDLESIPGFLVAGFLFVLAGPSILFGQILIWTYVAARALHFVAYATAQIHDVRATLWTLSSVSVLVMTGYVLAQAI